MKTTGAEIFGREREFVAVTEAATETQQPWALVMEGDPGVGKTTLWRLGVAQAEKSGHRVLTSSPGSTETHLSFSVLSDLLAEPLAEIGDQLAAPQRRALEVALLLEEVAGEEADARTVLAATLSCLRVLAESGPVVLAIDDMQWIDQASNSALAFALRRLGDSSVSVLGARRAERLPTESPELEASLEHRHGDRQRRLAVGPLSADVLHAAVLDRLGITFPHSVVEKIHRASGGNVFYALELARALERRPEALEPGASLPVPDTLQKLVRSRLENLSPPVRELLDVMAFLSEPTLAKLEAAGVRQSLEEAVAAGVIEVGEDDRVRFAHPLLASAASARLAPDAQRRLHGRLASLVEGEERARHLALGTSTPSAEVAQALDEAAREAAGRGAIGAAAELAEQALRMTPTEMTEEMRERQLKAAAYEVRHGDTDHARGHLEPLLAELPPGPTRAGVLLALARMREQTATRALELCRQAIEEAGPADVRAAEAHQLAAEMSMLSGDIPSALEHARLACQLAEAAGDGAKLIESLGTLCHYQTYTGTIEPGLLERAVEFEKKQPRPSNNYSPREILGLRLMYADRLDEARTLLEASYETAGDLGDELDRGALQIHLTQLECRAGRLAAADAYARACMVTHMQAGTGLAGAHFVSALVGAHLGGSIRLVPRRHRAPRCHAAAATRSSSCSTCGRSASWSCRLAMSRQPPRRCATCRRWWTPWVIAIPASVPCTRTHWRHASGPASWISTARSPISSNAVESSTTRRSSAAPIAVGACSPRSAATWTARSATRAFPRRAGTVAPAAAARPNTAGTGLVLRRAKRRREAREALTAALEVFDLVGTPLWAERAAGELARIPGRTASSGELSETERRVAELVAEGLSNKEVATRLFVSVRTVEANLSSIYQKLGLRSRSELVGRMSQR